MFPLRVLICLFVCSIPSAADARESATDFSGDQVVRVWVGNEAELELLRSLVDDFWNCHGPGIGENDVRVRNAQWPGLLASGLRFRVLIQDLQRWVDLERQALQRGGGPFDNYMNLAGVQSHMNQLVALRPDLVQTFTAGTSVEGRPIIGLRIGAPASGSEPGVLLFGGQHAREWITVATALYVADRLIRTYDTDDSARELVDRCDWWIIPVMNPDGYEYSWNVNRFWRKNRRNNGNGSFGVDLNRNWGDHWCQQGASGDPFSDIYCGPSPFSEPETQALRNILINNPNMVAFTDLHSYSQLIMWAWGWTQQLAPDDAELRYMGGYMRDVLRDVHGTNYGIGPVYTTIYPASGTSVDYAYGQHGVLAMTYELRDRGQFGFLLPAEQIIPTCEEVYPSLLWYVNYASTTFTPPGPFSAAEPQAGAAGVDPRPTFRWTASPLAVAYRLLVDDDPLFRTPEINAQRLRTLQYTPGAALEEGRTYYWRVTAENFVGTAFAPPAQAATFTTWRDCNHNGVDDEAEIAAGGAPDCNGNGRPDACDTAPTDFRAASPDLTPINANSPQTYVYAALPALGEVSLQFAASADLNLDSEWIDVFLNGALLGRLFGPGGADCPASPSVATLTLSASQYNALVSDGSATVLMVASVAVGEQCPFPSHISVTVTHAAGPLSLDANHDGVPDECGGLLGDLNCDGVANVIDLNAFVLALLDPPAYAQQFPGCSILNGDIDGDGATTVLDINGFVALILGG